MSRDAFDILRSRPLLVGEANPYGPDQHYALYPLPVRASGYHLCCTIMGLRMRVYLERFERLNLCVGRWSITGARWAVDAIMKRRPHQKLILLGAKVCQAFGVEYAPFERCGAIDGFPPALVLPHPSRRNRVWNDPESYHRARIALLGFGVLTEEEVGKAGLKTETAALAGRRRSDVPRTELDD